MAITLEACHAREVIEPAFARHGAPEIVNTDQRSQFTAIEFTDAVLGRGCKLSMDGRGAWRDNVFGERLWRDVKYERVYLKAYDSVSAARADIADYLAWYNTQRADSGLERLTQRSGWRSTWRQAMSGACRPTDGSAIPVNTAKSSRIWRVARRESPGERIRVNDAIVLGSSTDVSGAAFGRLDPRGAVRLEVHRHERAQLSSFAADAPGERPSLFELLAGEAHGLLKTATASFARSTVAPLWRAGRYVRYLCDQPQRAGGLRGP